MRGAEALARECSRWGLPVAVGDDASEIVIASITSVQGPGERQLQVLLQALALAETLGLDTVIVTVGGRRVAVDLDDVSDYLDGLVSRDDLVSRWG
jgi:hypothetical protein